MSERHNILDFSVNKMSLVAIIPAHNEGESIERVVAQTKSYVDQVLVVDDGSTDDTAVNAEAAGAEVLSYDENKGKGFALRKGFQRAIKYSPEYVVILDGDGEHSPRDIPGLLNTLKGNHLDLVVGTRFGKNKWARSRKRELLNKFTCFFMRKATGYDISDTNCGLRAVNRKYIKTVRLRENGFEIDLEMILEARGHNLRVGEVEASKPENYAETGFSRKHMIQMNNYFDRWIIENHRHLNISLANKVFLLASSYAGITVFQKILWLI